MCSAVPTTATEPPPEMAATPVRDSRLEAVTVPAAETAVIEKALLTPAVVNSPAVEIAEGLTPPFIPETARAPFPEMAAAPE
jgi:hypothetical protein